VGICALSPSIYGSFLRVIDLQIFFCKEVYIYIYKKMSSQVWSHLMLNEFTFSFFFLKKIKEKKIINLISQSVSASQPLNQDLIYYLFEFERIRTSDYEKLLMRLTWPNKNLAAQSLIWSGKFYKWSITIIYLNSLKFN
jgi:hypothetical protein